MGDFGTHLTSPHRPLLFQTISHVCGEAPPVALTSNFSKTKAACTLPPDRKHWTCPPPPSQSPSVQKHQLCSCRAQEEVHKPQVTSTRRPSHGLLTLRPALGVLRVRLQEVKAAPMATEDCGAPGLKPQHHPSLLVSPQPCSAALPGLDEPCKARATCSFPPHGQSPRGRPSLHAPGVPSGLQASFHSSSTSTRT